MTGRNVSLLARTKHKALEIVNFIAIEIQKSKEQICQIFFGKIF